MAVTSWRALLANVNESLGESHEARIIIEEAANESMSSLLLHIDESPSDEQVKKTNELLARRKAGEPLQHIVGHWPFRSLELTVDARALVPRPETEFVVEVALAELDAVLAPNGVATVLDLGTGTGAIALSIATERPHVSIIGVDSSEQALELARANCEQCAPDVASRVAFVLGDFYSVFGRERHHTMSMIVSNPPYLATDEWPTLDSVVKDFDPYDALVSGPTGYEAIDAVIDGAPNYLERPGVLVLEMAPHQGAHAMARAQQGGATSVEVRKDLVGRDRAFIARWDITE